MMRRPVKYFLPLLILAFHGQLLAQEKCATVAYQELIKNKNPGMEGEAQFESWMGKELLKGNVSQNASRSTAGDPLIIPVVVHVIHSGESVGTGSNISDDRILEQIDILNQDFRRLNADTINTPDTFKPVAADTEIEFRLAKRDPEGLATDGIQRVRGAQTDWDLYQSSQLKSTSYWPAEDYLNIWVAPLAGNFFGYAQFPVSNLPGLNAGSENRLTDGVVIDSDYFGNNNSVNPVSLGRTATHEIGHFLGLRHIWGDGPCGVDDFCADTPAADRSHFGCPVNSFSCSSLDMVENFLDLTDDVCMNLFTQNQKDRMQVVMNNSPRRASLATSKGAIPPVIVSNDAGIMKVIAPQSKSCQTELVPKVVIRNYGDNLLSSVSVQLRINGTVVGMEQATVNLNPLQSDEVSFGNFTIASNLQYEFEFEVLKANGIDDANSDNNLTTTFIELSQTTSLPISQTFDDLSSPWQLDNPDNDLTWVLRTAPNQDPNNQALYINCFDYELREGEYDYLIVPSFDLTAYAEAQISFDYAYSQFGNSNEGLILAVSTDCGNTYLPLNYLFEKYGAELATTSSSGSSFTPMDRTDWGTETFDLSAYLAFPEFRLAFIAVNDYGNNLYLDNIEISGVQKTGLDLAVQRISQPGIVSCENRFSPAVKVRNEGVSTISSFQVSYQLLNQEVVTIDYSGSALQPGEETEVVFPEISLGDGANLMNTTITQPNGQDKDDNPENDSLALNFVINQETDLIPFREDFKSTDIEQINWSIINQDQSKTWELTLWDNDNISSFINNYNYEENGAHDYLISPILDFSQSQEARLTFKVSYASGNNFNDGLLILATKDCGLEFTDTIYQKFGAELAISRSTEPWTPSSDEDWISEIVNLDAYAGLEEVRFAFVAVNDFGNNLYVDDIQFFSSSSTTSLKLPLNEMVVSPNPAKEAFEVSFNLEEREAINLVMVDAMGRILFQQVLANTLNQTYAITLPDLAPGMYVLQAAGTSFQQAKRLIISK